MMKLPKPAPPMITSSNGCHSASIWPTHRHEAADDTAAGNHKSDNDIHRQSKPDRYFQSKG
jgi:hypothetical protein